jgi:hypothetical protein
MEDGDGEKTTRLFKDKKKKREKQLKERKVGALMDVFMYY